MSPTSAVSATTDTGATRSATALPSDTLPTTRAGGTLPTANTSDTDSTASGDDIVAALANDSRFSTLATALVTAGLNDTLREAGPFTLFAPTNEAFAALPADRMQTLLSDPGALSQLLQYHVASGTIRANDLSTMKSIPTLSRKSITVNKTGSNMLLNGQAQVTTNDIEVGNGVIHQIDTVLMPTS